MESEKIQVRVSTALYKKLSKLAESDDRDLSSYCRRLMEDALLQKEMGNEKQA